MVRFAGETFPLLKLLEHNMVNSLRVLFISENNKNIKELNEILILQYNFAIMKNVE